MQRAVVLLVVLVFATSAVSAAAISHPRVRLVDRAPATVAGTYFRAAERVAVTLSAGGIVLRKTVAASTTGTFVARWRRALPDACAGTVILATGSAGSRAVYKLVPPPDCAPPLQPADK